MDKTELQEMISEAVASSIKKTQPPKKKYLTRSEVAEMLCVSLPTIHSYINAGTLKAEKIGGRTLFDAEKLNDAITEKEVFRYRHERKS